MVVHADTSFIVDAMRESRRNIDGPARAWLAENLGEQLAISVFAHAEVLLGARLHAAPQEEKARIRDELSGIPVILPDERFATTYARVSADLRRDGTPLATIDVLIGCVALNADAPILTANTKHFGQIAGLEILEYR